MNWVNNSYNAKDSLVELSNMARSDNSKWSQGNNPSSLDNVGSAGSGTVACNSSSGDTAITDTSSSSGTYKVGTPAFTFAAGLAAARCPSTTGSQHWQWRQFHVDVAKAKYDG